MTTTIRYEEIGRGKLAVYLGNAAGAGQASGRGIKYKRVGVIFPRDGKRPKGPVGFQYVPNGQKSGGEVFGSLAACKRSLEAE